ncbi:MAG TPA: hypothetical protein VN723_08225 [Rhizomicrobium sp.]|jgi:hypothetical protein|nr:hypothetical protein [Rhizomicrobium sp.]
MPQPCFDRQNQRLSERLLTAGIAPRHVRRYVRELSDHFDDLVREESAAGAGRTLAETRALSRLGNDDDLADAMLSRPELRSFMSRFPWAVFGLGPIALLVLSIFGGLYFEVWLIDHTGFVWAWFHMQPSPASARIATKVYTAYNTLIVFGAPLLFAWLFYRIGSRQRMRPAWIIAGVALVCILGGFQNLIFYDTGCKGCGQLLVQSAFIPPFPHFAEGVVRAAVNLAIAGGIWLAARRKVSTAIALRTART